MPDGVHTVKSRRFAQRLNQLMKAKKMSTTELSDATNSSYEHVRKLTMGEALPSKGLVKELSSILKASPAELQDLADFDRMQRKFGSVCARLAGRNPEIEPLNVLWPALTETQKDELIVLARFFIDRNQTTPRS